MKYTIAGDSLPVVICTLEAGEAMITERGSMSWMTPNMKMETTSNGGVGKAFARMFAGESFFMNRYTAERAEGLIAFASSFPGSIRAIEIEPDKEIVVQKRSFLASTEEIELSLHFQKKLGAGFFGGEGFIMQKIGGNGIAFIEIDGHACEYTLTEGQSMIVDTGYLVAMDSTCSIDIVTTGSVKNAIFGGEGIFNTVVKGPGKIILQTMPIQSVARTLSGFMPSSK